MQLTKQKRLGFRPARNITHGLISLCVSVLLVMGLAMPTYCAMPQQKALSPDEIRDIARQALDKAAQIRGKLEVAQQYIATLEAEGTANEKVKEAYREQVAVYEKTVQALQLQVQALEQAIKQLEGANSDLVKLVESLKTEVSDLQKDLKTQKKRTKQAFVAGVLTGVGAVILGAILLKR